MSEMKITRETGGRSQKKFVLDKNGINNGLSLGYLDSVEVTTSIGKENHKVEAFRGKEIPRLTFVFKQKKKSEGDEQGTYYHSYNAVDHNAPKRDVIVKAMFETIFDFIKIFKGGIENVTDAEIAKLDTGLKSDADYKSEDVLAAYHKFFKTIAGMFNGVGETPVSLFKTADKAPKLAWMKLLLYTSFGDVNNGNPGFPMFLGDGFFELYVKDVRPSIKVHVSKGEGVDEKPKATAMPLDQSNGSDAAPDFMTEMPIEPEF